jgi:hypothetical protein
MCDIENFKIALTTQTLHQGQHAVDERGLRIQDESAALFSIRVLTGLQQEPDWRIVEVLATSLPG